MSRSTLTHISALASAGALGPALSSAASPYTIVWHIEIALLFATLVVLGPLARTASPDSDGEAQPFGLQEFPA